MADNVPLMAADRVKEKAERAKEELTDLINDLLAQRERKLAQLNSARAHLEEVRARKSAAHSHRRSPAVERDVSQAVTFVHESRKWRYVGLLCDDITSLSYACCFGDHVFVAASVKGWRKGDLRSEHDRAVLLRSPKAGELRNWERLAGPERAYRCEALFVYNDHIHLMGQQLTESGTVVSLWRLEKSESGHESTCTWTWVTKAPENKISISMAIACIGDTVVLAGGQDRAGTSQKAVNAYSFRTGKWEPLPDIPEPLNGAELVPHKKLLLLFAGRARDEGVLKHNSRAVFCLDMTQAEREWKQLEEWEHPLHAPGVLSIDGVLVTAGGRNMEGEVTSMAHYWDPITQNWLNLPRLHQAVALPSLVGFREGDVAKLFCIGGYGMRHDPIAEVQCLTLHGN